MINEWLKKLSSHEAEAPPFPVTRPGADGGLFTYATDKHTLAVCRGTAVFKEKPNRFTETMIQTAWAFLSSPATCAGQIDVGMLQEILGAPDWGPDRGAPSNYIMIRGVSFGVHVIGRAVAAWPSVLATAFLTPARLKDGNGDPTDAHVLILSDRADLRVLCASFDRVTDTYKETKLPDGVLL